MRAASRFSIAGRERLGPVAYGTAKAALAAYATRLAGEVAQQPPRFADRLPQTRLVEAFAAFENEAETGQAPTDFIVQLARKALGVVLNGIRWIHGLFFSKRRIKWDL